MASYLELFQLASDSDLQDRVTVALAIEAEAILEATPVLPLADVAWASFVVDNLKQQGQKALQLVLAANNSATISQIQGSTDASLQSNVNALVPSLVLAHSS